MARVALAFQAAFFVGTALIFPAVLAPQRYRWLSLIAWLAMTGGMVLRAFRVRLESTASTLRIVNYWTARELLWSEIEAIVPVQAWASGVGQTTSGAAAFRTRLREKPFPATATMSWRWRFGGTSHAAKVIHRTLQQWAELHGVPIELSPSDLA